jgi:hypothetical protein
MSSDEQHLLTSYSRTRWIDVGELHRQMVEHCTVAKEVDAPCPECGCGPNADGSFSVPKNIWLGVNCETCCKAMQTRIHDLGRKMARAWTETVIDALQIEWAGDGDNDPAMIAVAKSCFEDFKIANREELIATLLTEQREPKPENS